MQGLFWAAVLFGMGLIVRIRFAPEYDEACEVCLAGIDTARNRHIEAKYAVEMGDLRAYASWFFCSEQCELIHLESLAKGRGE